MAHADHKEKLTQAIILPTENYHKVFEDFVLIDSLQMEEHIDSLTKMSFSKDSIRDLLSINNESTNWSMLWWGANDSIAKHIYDSLESAGYDAYYGRYKLDQYSIEDYKHNKEISRGNYTVLGRKIAWSYLLDMLSNAAWTFIIIFLFILFIGIIGTIKSIWYSLKFKKFLTEDEKNQIWENYGRYSVTRLLFRLMTFEPSNSL